MNSNWLAFIGYTIALLAAAVLGTYFRLPIWLTALITVGLIAVIGGGLTYMRRK